MVEIFGITIEGANQYYALIIAILVIFVLYLVLARLINRAAPRDAIPPDLINALRVMNRFGAALLTIYATVLIFDLGEESTLSLSIFIGSLVSFASMYTIQNFVAGFYLIVTRPFKVNDFVKIGSIEGVVTKISLNYTTILDFEGILEYLPNKAILSTTIINYDHKHLPENEGAKHLISDAIKKAYDDGEYTRYTFVWGAPLINLTEMKKRLDEVCDEFTDVFGYRPEYIADQINHRFEFTFILKAEEPITILKNKADFLDEISLHFH